MDNIPTVSVSFCLSADLFDLDYVTKTIGLQPTVTRTRESFRIKEVAHTEWYIEIIKEKCFAISIPFEELIHILENKLETINKLREELNLEVILVVVIHIKDSDRPEVVVPREAITFAVAINAEIDFDLYCYE